MAPTSPFRIPHFLFFVSWLWIFIGLAAAQTVHTVRVGWDGSFFSPATVSALLNDTVRFVFAGNGFHSVAQSSFDSPCSPLRGGFDSNAVRETDDGQFPTWDLRITNVSEPIWYFCYSSTPSSHCNAGMVGVINPPSIQNYNDFVAAARTVTGTPQVTPTLRLTGKGAVATASPAILSSSIAFSSSTTESSSSQPTSSTASSTSESSSPTAAEQSGGGRSSNKGAIIGGSVAGAIVALALLILLFWYLRRRNDDATVKQFFNYGVPAPIRPPSMMMSPAGRRVMPPPEQPHFTTPTPVVLRPRRRSYEQDIESNRESLPTVHSSEAKSMSSMDGFQAVKTPPLPLPLPRSAPHPYGFGGHGASDDYDAPVPFMDLTPSPPQHQNQNTKNQYANGSQVGHGGSQLGHGASSDLGGPSSSTQAEPAHAHNTSTSTAGGEQSGVGKRPPIPARELFIPSLITLESTAPPIYQQNGERN